MGHDHPDPAEAPVADVLNLIALAKSDPGRDVLVPGTAFEVLAVRERLERRLDRDAWLVVLEGRLIVDLPFGDFRIIGNGEALALPAGTEAAYVPVEPTVVMVDATGSAGMRR